LPRAELSCQQRTIYWPELSSHDGTVWNIAMRLFHKAEADGMPTEDKGITFEGCDPSILFREFAAECVELAQKNSSLEKRAIYLKMASIWHQMAQRWEKKTAPSS
jgi:hypothetical protein